MKIEAASAFLSVYFPKKELEVFVGGLDRDAVEEDLKRVFQHVGEVIDVRMHREVSTNKNKGYTFVKFATKEQASRALSEMRNPDVWREHASLSTAQQLKPQVAAPKKSRGRGRGRARGRGRGKAKPRVAASVAEPQMARTRASSSTAQQPKPQVAAPKKGRGRGRGRARGRGRGKAKPRVAASVAEPQMARTRASSSTAQQPKPQVAAPKKGRGRGRGRARGRGRGKAKPRVAASVAKPQVVVVLTCSISISSPTVHHLLLSLHRRSRVFRVVFQVTRLSLSFLIHSTQADAMSVAPGVPQPTQPARGWGRGARGGGKGARGGAQTARDGGHPAVGRPRDVVQGGGDQP
ncbi:uncharacterized protein [Nicotiana sylvestris]|uniref:uncharacterized protein n=1 Tax=Nicotiana sylvestris TaxID=4096 RepID=UPI00388CAF1D